jgi:hypothetical protein
MGKQYEGQPQPAQARARLRETMPYEQQRHQAQQRYDAQQHRERQEVDAAYRLELAEEQLLDELQLQLDEPIFEPQHAASPHRPAQEQRQLANHDELAQPYEAQRRQSKLQQKGGTERARTSQPPRASWPQSEPAWVQQALGPRGQADADQEWEAAPSYGEPLLHGAPQHEPARERALKQAASLELEEAYRQADELELEAKILREAANQHAIEREAEREREGQRARLEAQARRSQPPKQARELRQSVVRERPLHIAGAPRKPLTIPPPPPRAPQPVENGEYLVEETAAAYAPPARAPAAYQAPAYTPPTRAAFDQFPNAASVAPTPYTAALPSERPQPDGDTPATLRGRPRLQRVLPIAAAMVALGGGSSWWLHRSAVPKLEDVARTSAPMEQTVPHVEQLPAAAPALLEPPTPAPAPAPVPVPSESTHRRHRSSSHGEADSADGDAASQLERRRLAHEARRAARHERRRQAKEEAADEPQVRAAKVEEPSSKSTASSSRTTSASSTTTTSTSAAASSRTPAPPVAAPVAKKPASLDDLLDRVPVNKAPAKPTTAADDELDALLRSSLKH